jgi:hypothetical protein
MDAYLVALRAQGEGCDTPLISEYHFVEQMAGAEGSAPGEAMHQQPLSIVFCFIAGALLALITTYAVRAGTSQTCGTTDHAIAGLQHAN